MAYADESQLRVAVKNGLTAGLGHEFPLGEIAAAGAEKNADGTIWYVSGLWLEFADTITTLSTQAAATAGRRFHEFVSAVELNLPGWPERTVFRAGGRSLRRRAIGLTKKLPVADPADTTDADATISDRRRVLYVPFRRYIAGFAPNDWCIPAALFDRGSLRMDLVANFGVTGVDLYDTDVVVRADLKRLTPRQPTPWRFLEHSVTLDTAFRVPSSPEALSAMWGFLTGARTSATTENQFAPTVGIRAKVGGAEILDGRVTIEELNESYNADLSDAAIDETASAPVLMPLMNYGRGVKSTQLQSGVQHFPQVEGSATITAASGNGTATLKVCTEEILAAPVGSHAQVSFMRQMGATGPVSVQARTASKAAPKVSIASVRLPKSIKSLARSALSTRSRFGL